MLNVAFSRATRPLAVVLVAFLLTACAQLGLAPASSLDQRIAYAASQNSAVRQAAANAYENGEIQLSDAQFVLKTTDEARTLLDAARAASGVGDVSTAEGRLALAASVLVQVQNYLRSQK